MLLQLLTNFGGHLQARDLLSQSNPLVNRQRIKTCSLAYEEQLRTSAISHCPTFTQLLKKLEGLKNNSSSKLLSLEYYNLHNLHYVHKHNWHLCALAITTCASIVWVN